MVGTIDGELIYAWKVVLSGETWIFIKVWTCEFKPDKMSGYNQGCNLTILQCLASDYKVWIWKNVQVDRTWKKCQVLP